MSEKCFSNTHDDKNHLRALVKPTVSQAPPLRLLMAGRGTHHPGESYHLGNTVWKHLALFLTRSALYAALVSQEKLKKAEDIGMQS